MSSEYVEASGTGSVAAVPDIVMLSFRFEHKAPDVGTAIDGCAAAVGAALGALDRSAGDDHKRQTDRVAVSQTWNRSRERYDGYEASQTLTVRLPDLDRVGAVISATAEAAGPAFRMNDLTWAFSDTSTLLVEARRLAVADARATAGQLAEHGGRGLGNLVRIVEHGSGDGGEPVMRAMKLDLVAGGMPTEPGEGAVEVHVTARWLLVD